MRDIHHTPHLKIYLHSLWSPDGCPGASSPNIHLPLLYPYTPRHHLLSPSRPRVLGELLPCSSSILTYLCLRLCIASPARSAFISVHLLVVEVLFG
ncbi:uncharacterized protein CC84DRAFT_297603 [Paraphaeosphaeria sporulosa]|uniref:Uncharacterized protein n=1 Tax=Paraphaeosphaeria sporulosa TaxID=1460663 RepID=A0A177C0L6_9PLEO|nr:uncharacterized protein CC84DRAFT_297603 [Paraphaeosphaeria sporulosa]OAG00348.1 hypothetical protein CC84DRAFT_297603 [Paraphaeosphaeria sporulosa]